MPDVNTALKVCEIMSRPVVTTESHQTADQAWLDMKARRIHHLVVVSDGEVVGVISRRDLTGPRGGVRRRMGRSVGELMHREVVTASPSMTIQAAAALMRRHSVACIPIVLRGKVVGVVTASDLLRELEQHYHHAARAHRSA